MEKLHMKAALYCRVSTAHQVDKDSLPVQKESLIAYAQHVLGIDSYEVFTDAGYSGKNTDRPAYQDMMQRCRRHEFTHILVYKIDRISRNLMDFAAMYDELKQLQITFISRNEQFDTSSAIGEAMLKIILIFAELERKMTSERVTGIMIARAKKGLWNGAQMPLGYTWDSKTKFPIINSKEAETVRFMFSSYLNGWGTSTLSNYLNDHGIPTKRGGKWTSTTVRHILKNPMFKGTLRYNYRENGRGTIKPESEWVIIDDVMPAIVSAKDWDTVQSLFSQRLQSSPAKNLRKGKNDYAFARLIYCKCGSPCYAKKDRKRKDGYTPSVYYCHNRASHHGCTNAVQPSDMQLIPFVFTYIQNLLHIQTHAFLYQTIADFSAALLRNLPKVREIQELSAIFRAFQASHRVDYKPITPPMVVLPNHSAEIERIDRALTRLKELYLFSDDSLNRDEYLQEKRSLLAKKHKLTQPPILQKRDNHHFLAEVSTYTLTKLLQQGTPIDYPLLARTIGDKAISDFLHVIIIRIDMDGRKVRQITFANGITHRFSYLDD